MEIEMLAEFFFPRPRDYLLLFKSCYSNNLGFCVLGARILNYKGRNGWERGSVSQSIELHSSRTVEGSTENQGHSGEAAAEGNSEHICLHV